MTVIPRTLFQLAGREPRPPRLDEAVLVLIDYQNEYLREPLRLDGVDDAVDRAAELLAAARAAGSRIVHVAHRGASGGFFDRGGDRGAFIPALRPMNGEAVVEKIRPNGFSETDLAQRIGPSGTPVLIAGFMTHNCVSSTVRAALDLGYAIAVAADACATRDLPGPDGAIPAASIQAAELAALADRHAFIGTVAHFTGR
ncbi:isochorismatase family protein [Consotaella aegiceratis]|uniref:isochorismatase family protein n=1 Tax=Consotaella aegiceratis TaxID=3097961 RepID=UPI002F41791A